MRDSDERITDYFPDVSEYAPTTGTNEPLSGMDKYPTETKRPGRKRRNPDMWSRNIRKKSRLEEREYVSSDGTLRPDARMLSLSEKKCRLR
ncbi:hypothetical protein HHI36_004869 [Cryptolaemus montrouzieri]|uniref:Uncharacterized protein n=1 Tax=Cryptolaemus montrouzieri TaxID=559131 RepID=A0ABD2NSW9_9CUCU